MMFFTEMLKGNFLAISAALTMLEESSGLVNASCVCFVLMESFLARKSKMSVKLKESLCWKI